MTNFVICYDVRAKNHDYSRLYTTLNGWGAVNLQNSVWLAALQATAEAVRDGLQAVMHPDDTISVMQMPPDGANSWATSLDRTASLTWLKAHWP